MRRPFLALFAALALAACGDQPTGIAPAEQLLFSRGQNGTGLLVSLLTVGVCQTGGQLTASGAITVTNEGSVATEGLTLSPRMQYKAGRGPFQNLAGAAQTIVPAVQLAAGSTETYAFSFTFTPVAGAKYRLAARVTITNHSGSLGTPKGPEPKIGIASGAFPSCNGGPVNTASVVSITGPVSGSVFTEGTNVSFTGTANDVEDGDLSAALEWSSSLDGGLGEGASVAGLLTAGVHTVTASVTDGGGITSMASITVRINARPTVNITAPQHGTAVTQGSAVTLTGNAADAEDGDLSAAIAWTSSLDGALGTGASVATSTLSAGTHTITASVTDNDGAAADVASITLVVEAPVANIPPQVNITSPGNGSTFSAGANVTFNGSASDAEDGNLSASIAWSSNVAGSLGSGASVASSALSVGPHTITAQVTDTDGASASASINITIEAAQATPCSTPTPAGFTKSWIGTVSADWATAGNWSPSGAPAAADNVFICAGRPHQPTLAASTTINDLLVENGATLTIAPNQTLTATGNVSAGNTIAGAGTVLMTGAGKTVQGTLPNFIVGSNGTVALAGITNVNGDLNVRSPLGGVANLDLAARTLNVTGNFITSGDAGSATDNFGTFTMDGGADVLDIGGNVQLFGGISTNKLTAGIMRVAGNFTAGCGNHFEFRAAGTHTVVMDGVTAANVSICFSGETENRFANLQITNPAGVTFVIAAVVTGDLTVGAGATANFAAAFNGTTRVLGNVTSGAGSTMTGPAGLAVGGVLSVAGSYSVGTTQFIGSDGQVVPVLSYQNVVINVDGTAVLAGATTLTGNLEVLSPLGGSANLDLNGKTLHVMGNFRTGADPGVNGPTRGTITMDASNDLLDIDGNANFDGGNTVGKLTAGEIRLAGNFGIICGNNSEFHGSGTHLVVLDGTAAQTVNFCFGSFATNTFFDLRITNTVGVTVTSAGAFVADDLDVLGGMIVNGSLTIGDTFTLHNGSSLNNTSTITAATCVNNGGTVTNSGTLTCTAGGL